MGRIFNIAVVINLCLLIIHELFAANLVSIVANIFNRYSIGGVDYFLWMMNIGFGLSENSSDGSVIVSDGVAIIPNFNFFVILVLVSSNLLLVWLLERKLTHKTA